MFHINIIEAPRFVNSKSTERNKVYEVLITNYIVDIETFDSSF